MRARLQKTPHQALLHPKVRSRARTERAPHVPTGRRGRSRSAPAVPLPPSRAPQCIVKASYKPAGRAAGYADYMQRDTSEGKAASHIAQYMQSHGGPQHGRADLFTREGEPVDLQDFLDRTRSDPRVWTLIVSPQEGHQLEMRQFARAFMAQVEGDIKRTVDWLGVIHTNTPHIHTHLLIRGTDRSGKAVTFTPAYLKRGMRHRGMSLQAAMLSHTHAVHPSVKFKSAPADGVSLRERIAELSQRLTPQCAHARTPGASRGW